jgi:hypothetical protein
VATMYKDPAGRSCCFKKSKELNSIGANLCARNIDK